MKLAFLGLGAMGYPMAGHLSKIYPKITAFNRSTSKATRWAQEHHGDVADTPESAVREVDFACLCVGNDNDVRSIIYGEHGVLSGMKPGSILIDHTTTSAELAAELADACKTREVDFLDAPVSGGEVGAQNGKLTIMVGGEQSVYDRAIKVFDTYAQKYQLMGPVGSGQKTKMVNQICIAGLLQGLSEAMRFAQNAQLDTGKVIDVISKGAAQSWQMDNRAKTMLDNEFDFGFAVDWMIKDLGIVLDEAKKNGSHLPVTELVETYYRKVSANGNGKFDTSSLITLLK